MLLQGVERTVSGGDSPQILPVLPVQPTYHCANGQQHSDLVTWKQGPSGAVSPMKL